jgi:hypothetical protein
VNDFKLVQNSDGQTTWYCLHPLVVCRNESVYHLIGGQQRLTSIYLILYYLNMGLVENRRKKLFVLNYETRPSDWINVIDDGTNAQDNIDFLYIYNAYQTIKKWFADFQVDEDDFRSKLSNSCKFIWYDIAQKGLSNVREEDVFIRLNIGKISLTDAELIKALFLNSSNFSKGTSENEVALRQLEIASQWDIIEEELTNDEFWYFINGKSNPIASRIEYLFGIIAQNEKNDNAENRDIFRFFQQRFDNIHTKIERKDRIKAYENEWENIYTTHQILKEWYVDTYYYHHIGYMLCTGILTISELIDECRKESKAEFKTKTQNAIKEKMRWDGDDIYYGDNRIKNILLLHNIITMIKQKNERAHFPFDKYIKEKWDIEHIHARGESVPEKLLHRKEWLSGITEFITEEALREEAEGFAEFENQDNFIELYTKIEKHFFNEGYEEGEDLISNLALLDSGTNRGYGCSPFAQKRKTIIEKDKDGKFIPVCTRNVFQKYYAKEHSPKMSLWDEDDKDAYFENIITTLEEYISNGTKRG